jgi:small nuclear ribonucleoprotein (snRNP)-like protein
MYIRVVEVKGGSRRYIWVVEVKGSRRYIRYTWVVEVKGGSRRYIRYIKGCDEYVYLILYQSYNVV